MPEVIESLRRDHDTLERPVRLLAAIKACSIPVLPG